MTSATLQQQATASVTNVVAGAELKARLHLPALAHHLTLRLPSYCSIRHRMVHPQTLSIVLKMDDLRLSRRRRRRRVTGLLYPTGQLTVCGASSEAEATTEAENLTRLCAEFAGCATPAVRIKTVTASCVFHLRPNHPSLDNIKNRWPNHASLEPEIFNGLVLQCDGSVKLLVFHSWRCIIAGARSVDDATAAIAMLCDVAKLDCKIVWSRIRTDCAGLALSSEP